MPDRKRKIKLKLYVEAIIAFTLVITLLLLLATRLYHNVYDKYVDMTLDTNQSIANLTSSRIEDTFNAIRNNLDLAGETANIGHFKKDEILILMKSLYDHFEGRVVGVTRMDTTGCIVATWPDTNVIGQNISNQTHVIQTIASHKSVISCPINTVQGFEAIAIHEPCFLHDSLWFGNICALISLNFIEENLTETGVNAFIIDSIGQVIYHPEYEPGQLIRRIYDTRSSEALTQLFENPGRSTRGNGIFVSDSNDTYLAAFSPIYIGSNIWILVVYSDAEVIDKQLGGYRNELLFALIALSITIAVAFGGIIYFSFLKDRQAEVISSKELITHKSELLHLTFDSFQMLIEYGNENRAFQIICDSLRDVADLRFAAICKFNKDDNSLSIPGVSYKKQKDRKSFFEIADTIPQKLKPDMDTDREEYRSLILGHSVRITSLNQIFSLHENEQDTFGKLLEIMDVPDLLVIPLIADERMQGLLLIVDRKPEAGLRQKIEDYISLTIQMIQLSNDIGELQHQNFLYADILRSLYSGIHVVDRNLRLIYFNRNLKQEFNLSEEDVGRRITEVMPYIKKHGYEKTYREIFRTERTVTTEETSYLKDTTKRYVRTSLIPIVTPTKGVENVMTIIENITRQRELAEELKDTMRELKKLASTDGLTELYNYRYFSEALPKMMVSAREAKANLCLVVLDLDNLKAYNDLGGHHYGDNLLRVVGHILTQHQSPGDIVARYGGDEFVMIMKNTELEIAKNRAELIRTSILAYPFRDEEYLAGGNVTASFGVAALTDDVEDSDDLMRRADRALYRAKADGKNRVRVWKQT